MKRNKEGQFTSIGLLGNQFAKGNNPNQTSFKKGERVSIATEFKKGEMSERQKGENNSNWKGGLSICIDCGRITKKVQAKRCRICNDKYRIGENSHNWLGGKSFEPYTVDWTKTLKRSIRERDNYSCQMCGMEQGDETLSVHHIDYDKKNCNPNNLISLCRVCHLTTNQNRDYWTNYFNNK